MTHTRTTKPSIGMTLWNWAWYRLAQHVATVRANPKAVMVAAYIARTGNPPGA